MWRLVLCPPDPRYPSVRSHNDQRCQLPFHGSIEEREALDVQHVHFVDEQYTGYNLRFALFSPFCHFGVDLISQLRLDFAGVT